MARVTPSLQNPSQVNVPHAKWIGRVLNMLIAVIGQESLLGQILRKTQSEIKSLIQDETANDA